MTEQSPSPDPTTSPQDDPPAPTVEADDQSGWAVYDVTLKRFVTGVADSKAAANKAATRVKGHTYEARKV